MFDDIDVRSMDRDAFEVIVNVSGGFRNLQDVGYGVASLLPLLNKVAAATSLGNTNSSFMFLLQQPEVHIHPSAQANLVKMMTNSAHAFVVETHSDHVIDWVRILVREGELAPSDVAIIYFERLPGDDPVTRLHQISLDRSANFSGQPRSFRTFFSIETSRLLGLSP